MNKFQNTLLIGWIIGVIVFLMFYIPIGIIAKLIKNKSV